MYTVQIGRQFWELYKRKTGKDLSALELFEEEFFPVLFDAEDHLHLMQVTNSSFFQRISKKDKKNDLRDSVIKKDRLLEQVVEVSKGEKSVSGAVAVGFMAGDVNNSTSGQISTINFDLSQDNILYSWFGGALGVGFGGGYDFLFNNKELLWFVYEGWKYYRKYLNQTPKMKGRQIETWNGLWITYGLEYKNDLDKAFRTTVDQISGHTSKQGGYVKLERPEWADQVFSLARYLSDEKIRELVYGYSYGQMNKTLGFLYLELSQVKRMPEMFEQLILQDGKLKRAEAKRLEKVYQTQLSIEQACALGGLGVRALEPKDLYKYSAGNVLKQVKSLPKLDKDEKRITFITYITWIQAMLKNEETLKLAEEVADALIKYEGEEKRLRTRIKTVDQLWESSSRQQLIDQLAIILDDEPKIATTLNKTVDQLMTKIPQDMYRLFLTLVKFKYHYYQSK